MKPGLPFWFLTLMCNLGCLEFFEKVILKTHSLLKIKHQ